MGMITMLYKIAPKDICQGIICVKLKCYQLGMRYFDNKSCLDGFTLEISNSKYKGYKTTKFDY